MADIATLCHEREVFNSLCRDGRLRPPRERSERGSRLWRRGIFLAPMQRHCALSRATRFRVSSVVKGSWR